MKEDVYKTELMKNSGPLILIVVSIVLIILNVVFTSDEMNLGFWLRNATSVLLILSMIFTIRARKKIN